jgi:hypothetical protein
MTQLGAVGGGGARAEGGLAERGFADLGVCGSVLMLKKPVVVVVVVYASPKTENRSFICAHPCRWLLWGLAACAVDAVESGTGPQAMRAGVMRELFESSIGGQRKGVGKNLRTQRGESGVDMLDEPATCKKEAVDTLLDK